MYAKHKDAGASPSLLLRQPRASTVRAYLKPKADPPARAIYLLELFGLFGKADRSLSELSEGELAALKAAFALAPRSKLYLLDCSFEPLDFERRKRLWSEIDDLARKGAAIVISSRDPSIAGRCDEVAIIAGGRSIAQNDPRRLCEDVSPTEIMIEAEDPDGLGDLLPNTEIELVWDESGYRARVRQGDAEAVRLLRDGYGNVRTVVVRPPSLAEAWQTLAIKAGVYGEERRPRPKK